MSIRLSRILEVASAAVTVLSYLGLPLATLGGVAAGVVARFKELDGLESTLIALFVVAAVLHIVTSIIYIVDRITDRRRQVEQENAAIHYQLAPRAAVLIRDETNEKAEYQLRVKICNTSEYPLKYLIISTKAVIDDRVNRSDKPNYVPGIIPKGGMTDVRFNFYARGRLSKPGLNRGTLELVYRYGHASKSFVFESRRVYALRCSLPDSGNLAPGPSVPVIPVEMVVQSEQDDPLPISS
ncbi:MAG: hypothetical protein WBW81_02075 [Methylocella sp.]